MFIPLVSFNIDVTELSFKTSLLTASYPVCYTLNLIPQGDKVQSAGYGNLTSGSAKSIYKMTRGGDF